MSAKEMSMDRKIINQIKALGIDMIQESGSGHPGIVLGAATTLYTVYAKCLNFKKDDPLWINRDRFVMSSGHGSALLYATLYMAGVIPTLDDLKAFRKYGSITPGHPEYYKTPGVDMTTGPLGEGFASAVGMAIAERYLYHYYARNCVYPISHYTYVFCGDGDLMEGISYEAASLAGTLKLHKLIALYDNNSISLDGPTKMSFTEDVASRFRSMGWNVLEVTDGENIEEIESAINKCKDQKNGPSLIMIKNVIGRGSKKEGTSKIHGGTLESDDVSKIKTSLEVRDIPFAVSQEVVDAMQTMISNRVEEKYRKWMSDYNLLSGEVQEELSKMKSGDLSISMKDTVYTFPESKMESPRETSHKVLQSVCEVNPLLIGGSADVGTSTKTYLENSTDFSSTNYLGRNIWYGVREGAMGAIMNGISLGGLRNYGSTFLAFSDYVKPAIRLSALMNLPNIYIFTHDSVMIGPDGPTHQPVEQLISLRSIPNMEVFRPADANETLGAYKAILAKRRGPSALILSRNDQPVREDTSINDVAFGAYIVYHEAKNLQGIIIATGEEVHMAINVAKKLLEYGIDLRVVSMPSKERFEIQTDGYKQDILPQNDKTFVIEASSHYSWDEYVSSREYLFTVDNFGASASKEDIRKNVFYTEDAVIERIKRLFS